VSDEGNGLHRQDGAFVIQPQFSGDNAYAFSEGLAGCR